MKNHKIIFSVIAVLAVIFSLTSAFTAQKNSDFADIIETDGKYTVVEVEVKGEDRLEAIENGLIEALRLASGSFIDSKTELNNDELIER
ncbi:MAG: hypothetical protein IJ859_09785, partial [Synergistaceae bacterium]|nr:hypothetical protein [Synergistaceae bacterium]